MFKRKKTNSMEDADYIQSPCFAIDPDVELKEVPTSGQEYLLSVMKERQNIASVARCSKDLSALSSKQTIFAPEIPPMKESPAALRPTIEWQNSQVADFSNIRLYISKLQADRSKWPELKKITLMHEEDLLEKFFEENVPTLSSVLSLSQPSMFNGLEYLILKLDNINHGDTIENSTGEWIYAILACVQLPILSDSLSIFRDLARKCAELRSYVNPEVENAVALAKPYNLFICLVSKYFRQSDLKC